MMATAAHENDCRRHVRRARRALAPGLIASLGLIAALAIAGDAPSHEASAMPGMAHYYPWLAPEGIGRVHAERAKQPGFRDSMITLPFAFLKRGPKWTPDETEDLRALQAEHVARVFAMLAAGELATAGPLKDAGDLAGVFVFRGDSAAAHRLALADPAVRAGRLAVEMHPWMCTYGTFPGDTLSP